MNPRGCLVDLVSFLSSLAKEMPLLLSSRDAFQGGKETFLYVRLNPGPRVTCTMSEGVLSIFLSGKKS
jgi:hypothetical protein